MVPADRFLRMLSGRRAALVVGFVGFAVFTGTLGHRFVYDDNLQILENPWIWNVRFLPNLITRPVWAFVDPRFSTYYRPVQLVLYFLDGQIFGRHPFGFHLTSVLVHGLAASAAFLLLRRVTGEGRALGAALLFALHPAHVESVAWISGSTDVDCALLVFLALLAWSRARSPGSRPAWLAATAALSFLALLAKETAIVTPFLALSMPGAAGPEGGVGRADVLGIQAWWRRTGAPALLAFGSGLTAYIALRAAALGSLRPALAHPEMTARQAAATTLALLPRYFLFALAPWRPVPDRIVDPASGFLDPLALLGGLILVAAVAASLALRRRAPAAAWGLVLFFLPLAPALQVRFIASNLMADRYLYLPSLGVCLLVAEAAAWIRRRAASPRARGMRRLLDAAYVAVALAAALRTLTAAAIWRDSETLGRAGMALEPRSIGMRLSLIHALDESGRTREALDVATVAQTIAPADPRLRADLAGLRARLEPTTGGNAIAIYRLALDEDPDQPYLWANLAAAYVTAGLPAQAIEAAEKALALEQYHTGALVNLAAARGALGDHVGQEREARRLLAIDPASAPGWLNLGAARLAQEDLEGAEEALRRAAQLDPSLVRAALYLSVIATRRGDPEEAARQARRAANLDPQDAEIWNRLGVALARAGDIDGARRAWERALALRPGLASAAQNLERLRRGGKPGAPETVPSE